jgi:hypothetical protein
MIVIPMWISAGSAFAAAVIAAWMAVMRSHVAEVQVPLRSVADHLDVLAVSMSEVEARIDRIAADVTALRVTVAVHNDRLAGER